MRTRRKYNFVLEMHQSLVIQLMDICDSGYSNLSRMIGIDECIIKNVMLGNGLFTDNEILHINEQFGWTKAINYLPSKFIVNFTECRVA